MRQQSYLMRRGARYHFRRRLPWDYARGRPISISLGTAEPVEARRLARLMAVKWDELEMELSTIFERGTLSLDQREALFRKALCDELALATAHITAPMGATGPHPAHHKIMAAAYRIVARVPDDAEVIEVAVTEAEIDETWTDGEVALLIKALRCLVTPMSVNRAAARKALAMLSAPLNDGTIREARSHILRGYAEAPGRRRRQTHRGCSIPSL